MKKFFGKFKEILSVKRWRSLMILGLYIIFFIFIAAIARGFGSRSLTINTIPNPELTPLEKYGKYNNYSISYIHKETIIEGQRYESKELFTYNTKEYYKDKELYEKTDTTATLSSDVIDIFYLSLTPDKIKELIDKGTLKSKSEDFEIGAIIDTYIVKIEDFDTESTETKDGTILITTYEVGKSINQIDIDLSTYSKIENDKITIKYSEIGKITPFNITIEEAEEE